MKNLVHIDRNECRVTENGSGVQVLGLVSNQIHQGPPGFVAPPGHGFLGPPLDLVLLVLGVDVPEIFQVNAVVVLDDLPARQ